MLTIHYCNQLLYHISHPSRRCAIPYEERRPTQVTPEGALKRVVSDGQRCQGKAELRQVGTCLRLNITGPSATCATT